jgi:hypothetical protein
MSLKYVATTAVISLVTVVAYQRYQAKNG